MTKLQELLIKKISATTDEKLLLEIQRIFDTGIDEGVYKLNEEQIAGIKEAKEQIKNSQFLSNDEANKQAEAWLRKR